jgi:hypothetical protein
LLQKIEILGWTWAHPSSVETDSGVVNEVQLDEDNHVLLLSTEIQMGRAFVLTFSRDS